MINFDLEIVHIYPSRTCFLLPLWHEDASILRSVLSVQTENKEGLVLKKLNHCQYRELSHYYCYRKGQLLTLLFLSICKYFF